ncbi:MAG: hypothetical protein KDI30_08220 [Pseudomonadales bacterium]|nr:hypothetical protein [Pseudomonadales bacterium]
MFNRVFALLVVICTGFFLAACSSHYVAVQGASPETVFNDACAGCHHPLPASSDKYFSLSDDERNAGYIAGRILHGGVMMPAFPHIEGEQLAALSHFVLEHSVEKTK